MQYRKLILDLHRIGCIQFGNFRLASGIMSPIYIDLRRIVSYPRLLKDIAFHYCEEIADIECDLICGVPYTALPIATLISQETELPMVMRRKEIKDHGTKKQIEGVFSPNMKALIIEDLVTSGKSIIETVKDLESVGIIAPFAVALINREQGGINNAMKEGITIRCLMAITDILKTLENEGKIYSENVDEVLNYIKNNQKTTIG